MSANKRNSKRKTRLPNRLKDTDCSLNQMKKDDEIGTKKGGKRKNRVTNDDLGKKVDESSVGVSKNGDCSIGTPGEKAPDVLTQTDEVQTPKSNVSESTLPVNVQFETVKTSNVEDKSTLREQVCSEMMGDKCKPVSVNGTNVVEENVTESNAKEKQNTRSFAELVASTNDKISNKLDFVLPDIDEKGDKIVIFEEELVIEGCKKWLRTVCGYFVGSHMSLPEVKYNVRRMWGKHGLEKVSMNDNGFFFLKFRSEESMPFIIENGPWLINNKPMIVQKWEPEVNIEKIEPNVLPIWVKLVNVPMEAWTQKGISTLASCLGKPVIMDAITTRMCYHGAERFGFARVLVEVCASQECKDEIKVHYYDGERKKVRDKIVKVEYPWKPVTCNHCKVFGHNLVQCTKRPRTEAEIEVKKQGRKNDRENEGFKNVQNQKKKVEVYNKQKRTMYRPVESSKVNKEVLNEDNKGEDNKQEEQNRADIDKGTGDDEVKSKSNSPRTVQNNDKGKEKVWSISPDNMEALKRSSNRYNVLQNDYSNEFPTLISSQKQQIVDQFIKKRIQPGREVLQHWSDEMKSYFNENWKESLKEDEAGKKKVQENTDDDVFDDYSATTSFLTRDEVVNGSKNVLFEEGREGFFNE